MLLVINIIRNFIILTLIFEKNAFAYIGPGLGLGTIALTLVVLFGLIFLIFGLLWYPLKRFLKNKKKH